MYLLLLIPIVFFLLFLPVGFSFLSRGIRGKYPITSTGKNS